MTAARERKTRPVTELSLALRLPVSSDKDTALCIYPLSIYLSTILLCIRLSTHISVSVAYALIRSDIYPSVHRRTRLITVCTLSCSHAHRFSGCCIALEAIGLQRAEHAKDGGNTQKESQESSGLHPTTEVGTVYRAATIRDEAKAKVRCCTLMC